MYAAFAPSVALVFFAKANGIIASYHSIADFRPSIGNRRTGAVDLPYGELFAYRDQLFIWQESEFQQLPWCNGREVRGRLKDILLENGFVLLPFKGGLPEEELEKPAVLRTVSEGDVIQFGQREKSVEKTIAKSVISCHSCVNIGRLS